MTPEKLAEDITAQFPGVEFLGDPVAARDEDGEITDIVIRHSFGVTTWAAPGPDRQPEPRGAV